MQTVKFSNVFIGKRKNVLNANELKKVEFTIIKHIFSLHFFQKQIIKNTSKN